MSAFSNVAVSSDENGGNDGFRPHQPSDIKSRGPLARAVTAPHSRPMSVSARVDGMHFPLSRSADANDGVSNQSSPLARPGRNSTNNTRFWKPYTPPFVLWPTYRRGSCKS
eukprot:TRINITY_DN819_c0_g3_i2.p1 TRINITY_DN819_c0_g3~~TRINITY_DN819_c0_g3_i2.p1  ORF type:complete len:111 (+),score=6.81 TRINITY_DN819_c0_g3_i2:564-896(+)